MKKYTACLIDTALPSEHPFESTINKYEYCCELYDAQRLQESIFEAINCKRRFGFIHDELMRSGYGKTLGNISHLVTNIRWEGAQIWCDILVLDTREGKLLESLLDAGMNFCLVYDFYNFHGNPTIDVKSIDKVDEDMEDFILKRIDAKENLK